MVRSGQRHPAESADRQRRHAAKQLSVILPDATGAEGNGSRLARAIQCRHCGARGGVMSGSLNGDHRAGWGDDEFSGRS
jgi:hypothetical protein